MTLTWVIVVDISSGAPQRSIVGPLLFRMCNDDVITLIL